MVPLRSVLPPPHRSLRVRAATASFFFHPFLDIDYLTTFVDGLEDLGYEFVPAAEM